MRVLSWNCGNATAQRYLWDYLLELAPDVALLQEVGGIPKAGQSSYACLQKYPTSKTGAPQKSSTAILVRGAIGNEMILHGAAPWIDAELQHFAGNVVGVEILPERGPRLVTVCVYSPAWPVPRARLTGLDVTSVRLTHQKRDIWVADLLWAALCFNRPQPSACWIIGGDFNLCETFDSWRGRPRGNREYLERMSQLGLVDCLRYAKRVLTPTFRTVGTGRVTAQIDYLFVTDALRLTLITCDVGLHERVFGNKLSDHLPIVADFAVDATTSASKPAAV
jgi:exonuclease III